ncbi:MAG: hypothetical protein BWY09_01365 [Candidatus Hydrogenedentes bacterium ADurb.Bin179]|nr:MAG: hypothetical protein BWY09_01365 [Candidatus Hydrogenedentes bacterium ADurb.Bin179]
MGYKDEYLAVLPQQFQGAGTMDAGVFHFVQKHDRRITNDGGIRNQQCTGLPAGEFGHATVRYNGFSGQLVGKRQRLRYQGIRPGTVRTANTGMGAQKNTHGKVGKKIRMLRD